MLTVVAVVHLIFCLLLIALVLLQDPKSGGAGSMFGSGGTNSLFGATGAVTFLTRLTRYSAVTFGITCLVLTLLSRPESGSVLDSIPANAAQPAATPGATQDQVSGSPSAAAPSATPAAAPSATPAAAPSATKKK